MKASLSESEASAQARRANVGRVKAGGAFAGHPATSEKDYSEEDMEFFGAVGSWQNRTGRRFPSWSEVMGIVRDLGYEKPRAAAGPPSDS